MFREQLFDILLSLPNLGLAKDRQAFVGFLGLPKSITGQLEWEGTAVAFVNHLLELLIGMGRTELLAFLNKLAVAETLVGVETRQRCAELDREIAGLSEEEWRNEFGWAVPAPSAFSPAVSTPAANPVNLLSMLRHKLVEGYDLEELKTLCADLNVDYDSLGGEGKAAKARELVAFMKRRGRLAELEQLFGVSAIKSRIGGGLWQQLRQ